ncbi:hypothetical protein [Gimesia panareensis]|uniref:Uncharacterized protein n=1 Tax=Gimesia panareensis TaxID=2527978 RepID=A0A517Q994_9PLAN|nr:hypothetical protein [Gimesia panareensis]QDT28200.1 hypothetical protein Enr10x_35390 [Gimesia panareensis]QDU51067.1 hypothetical protein Pan110_34280 [Gimesia panareensis]
MEPFVILYSQIPTRDLQTPVLTEGSNFAESFVGIRTKFCPNVAGLCPVFVLIVSIFGQNLSRFGQIRGRTIRTGSNCSSKNLVKIDDVSGAFASLVRRVPVHVDLPRARARLGPTYDSAGADQGQIVQRINS